MVDVTPTLAALLGANIPAASQGRIRTEMLMLPPAEMEAIPPALEAQQNQLVKIYQESIGQIVAPQENADVVGSYQSALEEARLKRVNAERLPRAVLAGLLAILPLFWLFKRPLRNAAWLLGAAVLYLALFNLRYAVIDQRTYSLSSVASAMDVILYAGLTAALALLVAWIVFSWSQGIFKQPARNATKTSLDMVFTIIYLLSLPLLWSYMLNGALVSWTLPDFASMFLGFLSLLQILFVSVIGLVLAGVSFAVARKRA